MIKAILKRWNNVPAPVQVIVGGVAGVNQARGSNYAMPSLTADGKTAETKTG